MIGFKTIIYEKTDGIACVTLNRPEAMNAYNVQMRDDLYEVLRAIKDDDDVRVGIVKGTGEKAFCAGADLSEFLSAPPPVGARKVRFERDVWGLFVRLPQPMIAALHGYVLGSGIEIALCCDIRIASPEAKFGLPEMGLGIIPAAGGTQTLPRTIGRSRALEMLLTNRWIGAEEAYQFQLVNRIVAKQELVGAAEEMARKIASLDPMVVRFAKQAVVRGMDMSLQEGLNLERILASQLRKERSDKSVKG
jgi:enoyl-CoA hydratase/carnithine racemase